MLGLIRKLKLFFDIKNFKKLKNKINAIKPDIIFHLAAQSIVSKSFKNPLKHSILIQLEQPTYWNI